MKKNNVVNFNEMSLDKLVEYISNTHHSYLKEVIHSFSVHLKTMLKPDVADHAEVIVLRDEIVKLKSLLEQHITMEERILFPYINRLMIKNEEFRKTEIISANLIRKIKKEHLTILMIINKIRTMSKGYTPPVNSSPTLKLCYAQLFDLEQDIHRHVFVEENILFPKLLEYEKRLTNIVS